MLILCLEKIKTDLLLLFYEIEEAENDQQGHFGNEGAHANNEEGKDIVLVNVITYEISPVFFSNLL